MSLSRSSRGRNFLKWHITNFISFEHGISCEGEKIVTKRRDEGAIRQKIEVENYFKKLVFLSSRLTEDDHILTGGFFAVTKL